MKLWQVEFFDRPILKFRLAPDRELMATILAHPYRQRSTPISLPRYRPINYVLKEVAESSFLYVLREPVYLPVVLN